MSAVRSRRAWAAVLAAVILWPVSLLAQRGQDATLLGTAHDESGAALEAVTVTVSSPQLIGGSRTALTDARGGYRLSFLPPGDYQIAAALPGFRTAERDVRLLPGLTMTVDITLHVAAVSESVTVELTAPVIDVRTSASPTLIERALLDNLPLSRSASDTVNLAPGVVRDVGFGGSVRSNPFTLDGTNGNEPGWGTPTISPDLNWIDELQVVSIGADARYGEYTGVQLNAITRSGTNRFSGLGDYWTTRQGWTDSNRGSLTPQLQQRFRPLEITKRWDLDGQLGGPVVRDKLWFFSGSELYRNANRPASFSALPKSDTEPQYEVEEAKFIGKMTAAISSAVRVEGYYAQTTSDATGANAGPLVSPEALSISTRGEKIWNGRLVWTITPRTVMEFVHGGHSAASYSGPPDERRSGPPGHYDTLTGVTSVNYPYYSRYLSRPISTGGHLTYFTGGRGAQSHEIRAGFEYERARLLDARGYVGGQVYNDYDGRADMTNIGGETIYRPNHDRKTAYVQDGWSVTDRVTLNLGARAGVYGGSVPGREGVFSAASLSPRVGLAWDVSPSHRTVVRAHAGRYHDEMVTSFYDFLDPLSQGTTIVAQVLGPNQFQQLTQFGSTTNASIDPDLKFSYVAEYVGGIEQELPFGIAGRAQFIWRDFNDSIGFIDTGSTWTPSTITDPGPDGRVGTPDDGGPFTIFLDVDPTKAVLVLTNPEGAYRRYRAFQLVATKRYSAGLAFQGSYTWSRQKGSYNNAFSSNAANNDLSVNSVFVNPNRALNAEGRTPQDFTHELKALWTYRLAAWGGLNVSGVYRYQSGRTWARSVGGLGPAIQLVSVFVEPRATRQLDAVHTVDVRVEKTWSPRQPIRLGLFADVFNATNLGVSLRNVELSGPNFGVPAQWIEPRTLRAGVRMMF